MSDEFETWKTKVFKLDERNEALEKKINEINSGCGRFEMDYVKQIAELRKKFEAFKEGEDDDIKEIGILREELAELKEKLDSKGWSTKEHMEVDLKNAKRIVTMSDEDFRKQTEKKEVLKEIDCFDCPKREGNYCHFYLSTCQLAKRDCRICVTCKNENWINSFYKECEGCIIEYEQTSGGEKELPNRENGLNHSYGINGEPNVHHSKLPEPKCDDGSPIFPDIRDKFYSKKLGIDNKTEPENPDDREFIHFDEKLWISLSKHAQKQKELIEDIQDDLDSLNPGIPYAYEPLNKIKKKWQGRIK